MVDSEPIRIRRAIVLAGTQVGLTGVSLTIRGNPAYSITVAFGLASLCVLIIYSTYCVLRYVLKAPTITRDQIYAGICMYVMLGFAFAAIFYLVNILDPKSFSVNSTLLTKNETPDLMYFSFVTLATLGYGDITPRSHAARSLSMVEALIGMLYIAVFMARLVSLRLVPAADD